MNRFIILIAALCSIVSVDCTKLDWRIVGGLTAEDGQFPYQISLRKNGEHYCGGSILNEEWILTAAHCVYGFIAKDFTIVAGSNSIASSSNDGDRYTIQRFIYHSGFDKNLLHNDIALMKIDGKIKFNAKVELIPLNTKDIGAGEDLVLSGWGALGNPGNIPTKLQFIYLKSITSEECDERQSSVENTVDDTQICTFNKRGQGACRGDSGGPLVHQGTIAGVVSWGRPCAIGYPDVFTRVSSYLEWIQENVQ